MMPAILCLVALVAGLVFLDRDKDSKNDDAADSPTAAQSSRVLSDRAGSGSSRSPQSIRQRVEAILAITDPAARSAEFEALIYGLSSEELAHCHAVFWSEGHVDESVWKDYEKLLARWGEIAPKEGLQFFKDRQGARSGTSLILKSWAKNSPDAAVAWVDEAFFGGSVDEVPDYWLTGLIEGLAANDPGLATGFLIEMSGNNLSLSDAIDSILSEVKKDGEDGARKWVDSIENDSLKKEAASRLALDLATRNPQEAASLLESVYGENPDDLTTVRVFEKWMKADLPEAMDWLNSHSIELKGSIGTSIVDSLMKERDISSATDWLMNFPNESGFDPAIAMVVSKYQATGQPELAANWVLRLSDAEVKEKASLKFFTDWMSQDAPAATAFMNRNEVSLSVGGGTNTSK